jgi:hypothetical protein
MKFPGTGFVARTGISGIGTNCQFVYEVCAGKTKAMPEGSFTMPIVSVGLPFDTAVEVIRLLPYKTDGPVVPFQSMPPFTFHSPVSQLLPPPTCHAPPSSTEHVAVPGFPEFDVQVLKLLDVATVMNPSFLPPTTHRPYAYVTVFTTRSEYVPANGWVDNGAQVVPAFEDTKQVEAMLGDAMSSPTTTRVPLLTAKSRSTDPVNPDGVVHAEMLEASA